MKNHRTINPYFNVKNLLQPALNSRPDKPKESSIHAGYRTIFGINIAWICSIKASNLAIPWHYARPCKRLIRTSFAKS
jgi:hypothetical protein